MVQIVCSLISVGTLETMIMTETEGIDTDPVQSPREDDGIILALVHGHHLVIGGASAQVGLIWHLQVQLLCQVLQFQVCPFPPLTSAI